MTKWEEFFDEKIKEIAKEKFILDVGGGFKFQKQLNKYKDFFKDCDYRTLDVNQKYEPDILADIHNIPLADNSVDAIICKAVLEHVENPFKAVEELYRILKPAGKMLICLPFLYPYHANKPFYKDYWRFTEDGVRYLCKNFSAIEICFVRGHLETIMNLFPFRKKFPINLLVIISKIFDIITGKSQSKKQVSGYNIFLIK